MFNFITGIDCWKPDKSIVKSCNSGYYHYNAFVTDGAVH